MKWQAEWANVVRNREAGRRDKYALEVFSGYAHGPIQRVELKNWDYVIINRNEPDNKNEDASQPASQTASRTDKDTDRHQVRHATNFADEQAAGTGSPPWKE